MINRTFSRRAAAAGFSLIEVMVAVVIIGILTAVAVPSYNKYILRGHRVNATAILMETAQHMERYFSVNETFVGATLLSDVSPKGADGAGERYTISFTATPTATAWTLQAVPVNRQTSDACGTLTLSSTGAQTPTTKSCW
jgi:type IV pilus assembly protein PilE